MGGFETLGQIRKYNYALIRIDVNLFLSSAARHRRHNNPYNRPSQQRHPTSVRHHSLYTCGVIVFTFRTLLPHLSFSSKSASFSKSS
jgi:hypothetical protein